MRAARGFTLIELLVVMVILGLLISLAVLSTGNASTARELRNEAQRLAAIIGQLSDEAVLENREYGLLIRGEGYRVLGYDELRNVWSAPVGEVEHRLPSWARLELELDGEPLKLAVPVKQNDDEPGLSTAESKAKSAAPVLEPQLLLLSSGELSPFSLRLSERLAGGGAFELSSDGFQLPKAEPAKAKR